MKKTMLPVLLSLWACIANGQNFIDILVSDTLKVKAKEITYTVSVDVPTNPNPYAGSDQDIDLSDSKDKDNKEETLRLKESVLEQFFKSNNITYTLEQSQGYTISPAAVSATDLYGLATPKGNAYLIKVKNEQELKKIHEQLSTLDYINGRVSDMKYDTEGTMEAVMMENIYKKALKKAAAIAKTINAKLGKVTQVEEVKKDGFSNLLEMAFSKFGGLAGLGQEVDMADFGFEKTIRFRFELLP